MTVGGKVNPDAAWYYPKADPLARRIMGYVAFRNGVHIQGEPEGEQPALVSQLRDRFAGRR